MQHAVFCTNRILDTRPFLIFLNNLQSNSVALTEALRTGSGISGAITYFLFATTRQHQVFSTCTMSATHDILPDSLVQLSDMVLSILETKPPLATTMRTMVPLVTQQILAYWQKQQLYDE
mmetsp:Transcript_37271/g.75926  ORF Transcript_37271/g.75926 Transcript_37271/m.75926 type:complete len:120 (-) Transcript_37271:487-846(-)